MNLNKNECPKFLISTMSDQDFYLRCLSEVQSHNQTENRKLLQHCCCIGFSAFCDGLSSDLLIKKSLRTFANDSRVHTGPPSILHVSHTPTPHVSLGKNQQIAVQTLERLGWIPAMPLHPLLVRDLNQAPCRRY